MPNLPVPVPAQVVPGNFDTAALWNANVFNGLMFLLNRPLFYGYQGSSQTLTGGAFTAITMDTEVLDTYNGHSTTTNTSRYVAQVPGYYKVWGSFSGGGITSQTEIVTYTAKNGTELQGSRTTDVSSSAHVFVAGAVPVYAFLNGTTDYVELYGMSDTGGGTHTSPSSALFVEWAHA